MEKKTAEQIKLAAETKTVAPLREKIRQTASNPNSDEYKAAVKALSDFVAGR